MRFVITKNILENVIASRYEELTRRKETNS